MKLPIHRWFRYSAGFSSQWVEKEIQRYQEQTNEVAQVFDPFVGSGTTLLAAEKSNVSSVGTESHPFVYRIAKAKLHWKTNSNAYNDAVHATLDYAKEIEHSISERGQGTLLEKCYTSDSLRRLDALRLAYENLKTRSPTWELIWLNITSILRITSGAGTAQWQYVLPNKTKAKTVDPFEAFQLKGKQMFSDMEAAQLQNWSKDAQILASDSRNLKIKKKFNFLITSPPYPNNYDYADATRLEMTFWREIEGWKDLQPVVRKHLIRACSQHSAAERLVLEELLEKREIEPIRDELSTACNQLAEIRKTRGGKKSYHTMIAAYFYDLARIWINLRNVMLENCKICFVVGDSAPYGVYVPADKWIGELALSCGFESYTFEKLRDRNIKWKNRTHTVPLHEGRLWIRG